MNGPQLPDRRHDECISMFCRLSRALLKSVSFLLLPIRTPSIILSMIGKILENNVSCLILVGSTLFDTCWNPLGTFFKLNCVPIVTQEPYLHTHTVDLVRRLQNIIFKSISCNGACQYISTHTQ